VNRPTVAALRVWRLHHIPLRGGLLSVSLSLALVLAGLIEGLPLWGIALAILLPWLPIWWVDTTWQTKHYGLYGFFGALTLWQLGHMMEHTAELVQLFLNHGNLAQSHGVFGVLDNEVVHFYWNIAVWLGVAVLLYRLGSRNPWLWLAFIAASVHMVEHFYLYWLYMFHPDFWAAGGAAGILGKGGILGSPLDRPYLHFAYNYLEVVPLVIAFWDQSRHVYDRYLARAFPLLSEEELVDATSRLQRMTVAAGAHIMIHAAGHSERSYIVSKGEVALVHETASGRQSTSLLGPGESFETMALAAARRRIVSARAVRASELLILEVRNDRRHEDSWDAAVTPV
jgi:Cyclic nucleotide-binding domain